MTWRILIEQIKRRIKGGNPSIPAVWDEEIKAYAIQVINSALNVSFFQTALPSGDTTPDGYILAVYRNIEVEKWQNKSRAKMPAFPIRLPRNMGVFLVAPDEDEECQFIPIPAGQSAWVKQADLLTDEQVGYEVKDGYVVFTKEIEGPVQMHLVVMDFTHYKDTDILPVPADIAQSVVEQVAKFYIDQPMPDKIIDSGSEPTKQPK